jgi:hypothetical protein
MKVLVVFRVFVSYQQRIVIHIFHISFLQPASFVYSPGTLSLSDIPRLKVSIPSSINQLMALEYLSIARGSQEFEPLPSEIGDLSNLGKIHACILLEMFPQAPLTIFFRFPAVVLNLRQSTIRGTIPTEIGKLRNLGTSLLLMMISRHLCVHVPDLSFISEIEEYIDLGSNNFDNELITEIGLLENLKSLVVDDNSLDGFLPTEIGSLLKLGECNGRLCGLLQL